MLINADDAAEILQPALVTDTANGLVVAVTIGRPPARLPDQRIAGTRQGQGQQADPDSAGQAEVRRGTGDRRRQRAPGRRADPLLRPAPPHPELARPAGLRRLPRLARQCRCRAASSASTGSTASSKAASPTAANARRRAHRRSRGPTDRRPPRTTASQAIAVGVEQAIDGPPGTVCAQASPGKALREQAAIQQRLLRLGVLNGNPLVARDQLRIADVRSACAFSESIQP